MDILATLLQVSLRLYTDGRHKDASSVLRRALALAPAHADGWHLLGLCASALSDHRNAVLQVARAVRLAGSRSAPFLQNLSVMLVNYAAASGHGGPPPGRSADEACRMALALLPGHRDAVLNLAIIAGRDGRTGDAAALWRRAAALAPEHGESWRGLANVRLAAEPSADVGPALAVALALMPGDSETLYLLGIAAYARGNAEQAERFYRRAYRLAPNHMAGTNLTVVQLQRGHPRDSLVTARRAVSLRPELTEMWLNISSSLVLIGQPEAAVRAGRRALTLQPGHHTAHSNLLMVLQYLDIPPLTLLAENRRFDALHGRPRAAHHRTHDNVPDPDRPLRVGYVSSDFRQHVASCFFEPVLAAHTPSRVQAVCYSDTVSPDAVTRRLMAQAGAWRTTVGLSESAVAEMIRADGIDILVDLAGHSAGNRQAVFARRPAPVQVTWLGYPDSTGLSAIDYRLVDAVTDPEGPADGLASETLVRLPDGFLCYWPPQGAPEPGPLPSASGPVTFGSFNKLAKITPAVAALWAEILNRVPHSRLLLKTLGLGDPAMRAEVEGMFQSHGVAAGRLELAAWSATWLDHLELYRHIDIALDSHPYCGTTTTCEALWMGVPVVTLLGDRHAARVGGSLLARLGLDDLVARTPAGYVDIAVRLADDRERLAALRRCLRGRMRASPLCDAPGFTRGLEEAYRTMWRRWCSARNHG